jgi:hypothetical protein
MNRISKAQYFDSEGRDNLPQVIKTVKNYIRALITSGIPYPTTLVFFTGQGEGPMLAYNQLSGLDLKIIAVTFPPNYTVNLKDDRTYTPEIPDKIRKFFNGVEIPILTARLPFDDMAGAEFHNKEMATIRGVLGLFGGSMPLAIQAVLQATDNGLLSNGDQVIVATGDTALLVTASTTQNFLSNTCGLMINEIICKPRNFTISRRRQIGNLLPKPSAESELSPEIISPRRD